MRTLVRSTRVAIRAKHGLYRGLPLHNLLDKLGRRRFAVEINVMKSVESTKHANSIISAASTVDGCIKQLSRN